MHELSDQRRLTHTSSTHDDDTVCLADLHVVLSKSGGEEDVQFAGRQRA